MNHVSGRPSLVPGGLQACEMEQIRGTGSDGSAYAGSGQRPMSEQSPRPPRSLRATTTSGSRAGGRGAPEDRPGPGPGLRTEGRAGPVERRRQNAAEGDREGAPLSLSPTGPGTCGALGKAGRAPALSQGQAGDCPRGPEAPGSGITLRRRSAPLGQRSVTSPASTGQGLGALPGTVPLSPAGCVTGICLPSGRPACTPLALAAGHHQAAHTQRTRLHICPGR
ncbi:unnamed protein product [Rangifer tarandus platyrhynchus]|uniref:Uncharacterized protein n=1 Tax=Rangifer tarandus platyrhynchus TaxID=3082113 RepID=A0AC60A972_RANTA